MSIRRLSRCLLVAGGLSTFAGAAFAQRDVVDSIIEEQAGVESAARTSQLRIAQLDEEATKFLAEYRQTTAEVDNLNTYNRQLGAQVQSQEEEIQAIVRQLEQIETTASQVMPLMERMLGTLERFVDLDVPFLLTERHARVANLRDIMRRADVSVSEKYRRIIEAYAVEMEYGRTIEAYRGELPGEDVARTVDFLRLGRVALLYQTLDGGETGYWSVPAGDWVVDDDYRSGVRDGLRVAKQQTAPDLLIVPVRAPTEVAP